MTFDLDWPPKELSPNARGHWSKKAKAAKRYRADCNALCRQARPEVPEGKVVLELEFFRPDRRSYDDDNLIARMKSGRDGIADALGIDDKRFITRHSISEEVVKGGKVRVRLSASQGGS